MSTNKQPATHQEVEAFLDEWFARRVEVLCAGGLVGVCSATGDIRLFPSVEAGQAAGFDAFAPAGQRDELAAMNCRERRWWAWRTKRGLS